ncbi:unnamed protein product [Moneuplotes crassus]|uniref:Uncharacterized protein n=1 Tax=Euplotes crassus TaxID=5936 RepID=A0AAD1UTT0_EUPCR|nr:unnamed protein product [Moneuplotes crassus]
MNDKIYVNQETLPFIRSQTLLKHRGGLKMKVKQRSSCTKLRYIFEKAHEDSSVSEEHLLKERQKVFMRVHEIIKKKLSSGSLKHSKGFQSPRRLRRVLRSPQFRPKEIKSNLPVLESNKESRQFFSPQRFSQVKLTNHVS